jgi:hypothetical protein
MGQHLIEILGVCHDITVVDLLALRLKGLTGLHSIGSRGFAE